MADGGILKAVAGGVLLVLLSSHAVALPADAAPTSAERAQMGPATTVPGSEDPLGGQEAIDALGSGLSETADQIGVSDDELRVAFLEDPTLRLDGHGRPFYVEDLTPEPAGAEASGAPVAAAFPLDATFSLASRPGSQRTIYIDATGATVTGTAWNDNPTYGTDGSIAVTPYDSDANPGSFSDQELLEIQNIWSRMAEDYAPFDVNVTTADPGPEAIDRVGPGDLQFGTTVVVGGSPEFTCGCGGIAYIGVFDLTASHALYQPALVFTDKVASAKSRGEAASHEVGHNFGLLHDGLPASSYYTGHGPWAPIMGTAYTRPISQWSAGEYAGANNQQDDIAVLAGGGVPLLADDHGNTAGTATAMSPGVAATAAGLIGTRSDVDVFALDAPGGVTSISVTPSSPYPDLDVSLTLLDSNGAQVAAIDPPVAVVDSDTAAGLGASFEQQLMAGTYYVVVDGVGWGSPSTGYSDYASLGRYEVKIVHGLCATDVDLDDDGAVVAPRMMPGESVDGRRCAGDDQDWRRVAGFTGATISASLAATDESLTIDVVDGQGLVKATASTSPGIAANVSWTFESNTDHYLRVTGSPGVVSRYQLTTSLTACLPDDTFEGFGGANYDDFPNFGVPLALPGARDGLACGGEPNNADFSAVAVPQGGTLVVTLRIPPVAGGPRVWVFATTGGSSLASDTAVQPGLRQVSYTPPTGGTFAVAVTYGGSGQPYHLEARIDLPPNKAASYDFDSDRDTDRGAWRPGVGGWYIDDDGLLTPTYTGLSGDLPVAGDYFGDGSWDESVWRSSFGGWYVNDDGVLSVSYLGLPGDLPVPMVALTGPDLRTVFRPSNGGWYSSDGQVAFLGASGDIPVPGDYDGDGDTDRAVWRPSTGGWLVDDDGVLVTSYLGLSTDVPVPGDYDGDGDTDRAVWRPSTGGWFVDDDGVLVTSYLGLSTDVPVPGDYDGDGDTDRAVWRPAVGGWYVDDDGVLRSYLGLPGDIPVSLPPAIQMTRFPSL